MSSAFFASFIRLLYAIWSITLRVILFLAHVVEPAPASLELPIASPSQIRITETVPVIPASQPELDKAKPTLFRTFIQSCNGSRNVLQKTHKTRTRHSVKANKRTLRPTNAIVPRDPSVEQRALSLAEVHAYDAVLDIIDTVINTTASETSTACGSTVVTPCKPLSSPHSIIEEVLRNPSALSTSSHPISSIPDKPLPLPPTTVSLDKASIIVSEDAPSDTLAKIGDLGRRRGFKGAPIIVPPPLKKKSSFFTPLNSTPPGSAFFSSMSKLIHPSSPLASPSSTPLPQEIQDDYHFADPFASSPKSYYVPDATPTTPIADLTKLAFYDEVSSKIYKRKTPPSYANPESVLVQFPPLSSKDVFMIKTTIYDMSVYAYDTKTVKVKSGSRLRSSSKSSSLQDANDGPDIILTPPSAPPSPIKLEPADDTSIVVEDSAPVTVATADASEAQGTNHPCQLSDGSTRKTVHSHTLPLSSRCSLRHVTPSSLNDLGLPSSQVIAAPSQPAIVPSLLKKDPNHLDNVIMQLAVEIGSWSSKEGVCTEFKFECESLESAYGGLWLDE